MKGRKPDFIVSSVVDVGDDKSRWREIGVAFWNDKHESLSVLLDAVPLSGKLVLMAPKPRQADTSAESQ
jgi:hypothetical protein